MSKKADWQDLYFKAGTIFTPAAPVDRRTLFAGRIKQISDLIDMVATKGQHAAVYGERGVGKTSLVSVLHDVDFGSSSALSTFRENCHEADTFGRIWRRALHSVLLFTEKKKLGFGAETTKEVRSLATSLSEDPSPDEVITQLRRHDLPIIFVFDEFDQISDRAVSKAFSETIKALSDHAVATKIIVVGVGDTVDSLIEGHASIERAIRQVQMPRMVEEELGEIIDRAMDSLGMSFDSGAKGRIVRLSQGLPHYVHLVGLQSTRQAIKEQSASVDMGHVSSGISEALSHASQSLLDLYIKATSSPQKDNLYKHVLLACALAHTDELGYFSPASVRTPLKAMGRPLEIPAFAAHLNKFDSPDRGGVLQKSGTDRRFRYRFRNPLMQPLVVLKGLAEGLIDPEQADLLLAAARG